MERVQIIRGDITTQKVDAIVNAANTTLLGGGGVDGAIHRKAGHELLKECRLLNGCNTGEAKITQGYNLPAQYVIHTVGPVWSGGNSSEDKLLANCYLNCFKIAKGYDIKSIAFPAISTGVYHFPSERAAQIAINCTKKWLKENDNINKVLFICFDQTTEKIYNNILK